MSTLSGSKGRRSARDQMASLSTTREPVLPTAESHQLIAMTPLMAPNFVIQNEYWVHGGVQDVDNISVKFPVLDELESVDQARADALAEERQMHPYNRQGLPKRPRVEPMWADLGLEEMPSEMSSSGVSSNELSELEGGVGLRDGCHVM